MLYIVPAWWDWRLEAGRLIENPDSASHGPSGKMRTALVFISLVNDEDQMRPRT